MFNNKLKFRVFVLGLSLYLSVNALFAEQSLRNARDSKIIVKGTSTLHDWSMEAETFDCIVSIDEGASEGPIVNQISFSLMVENLKSDKAALDKNAYKALKTEEIQFRSTSLESLNISTEQVSGIITGDLTIAGSTKTVSFPFEGGINAGQGMECYAVYKINMKDFGIDPPVFMLGTLKTGAEVDVIIQLNLQNQ